MPPATTVFAQVSPESPPPTPEQGYSDRVQALKSRIAAYMDSLRASGVEEVFTLGLGGNAPQDPMEKMAQVRRGGQGFQNPEAHRISADVQRWGRALRWEFRDLQQPLVTRIEIHKGKHIARCFHGDDQLLETPIAVGNPEIGKATPEGEYHVLYVDFKPISRWIRGSVPYGHEYNPYGARQIPFFQDWTLHGNNAPSALGRDISKGCVRLHNTEILVLGELVMAVKTRVIVLP